MGDWILKIERNGEYVSVENDAVYMGLSLQEEHMVWTKNHENATGSILLHGICLSDAT